MNVMYWYTIHAQTISQYIVQCTHFLICVFFQQNMKGAFEVWRQSLVMTYVEFIMHGSFVCTLVAMKDLPLAM